MSAIPLTWSEINSWRECTELNLTTWELLTIKALSEAYVGEYNQASNKTRLAPYSQADDNVAASRVKVANKLKNAFASFKRSANPETN